MFDIGFSEIVVIGVVALVVIGPERLPKTARTLGHLFGRLQRYVNDVKADINREMELDELRRLRQEVQGAATELHKSVTGVASEVESSMRSVEQQLNDTAREASSTTSTPTSASSTVPWDAHAGVSTDSAHLPATGSAGSMAGGTGGHASPADAVSSAPDGTTAEHARQPSLPGFDRI
jgi:sec-independent protein translocase protein TatB